MEIVYISVLKWGNSNFPYMYEDMPLFSPQEEVNFENFSVNSDFKTTLTPHHTNQIQVSQNQNWR
jgi:hypothetical protein